MKTDKEKLYEILKILLVDKKQDPLRDEIGTETHRLPECKGIATTHPKERYELEEFSQGESGVPEPYSAEADSTNNLRSYGKVVTNKLDGIIKFIPDVKFPISINVFRDKYSEILGLGDQVTLTEIKKIEADQLTISVFQQKIGELPVENSTFTVLHDENGIIGSYGFISRGGGYSVENIIEEKVARASAIDLIKRSSDSCEIDVKDSKLCFLRKSRGGIEILKLCWRVSVSVDSVLRWHVDVDAYTNKTLGRIPLILFWAPHPCEGPTTIYGDVKFTGEKDAINDVYRLVASHAIVENAKGSDDFADAVDFISGSPDFSFSQRAGVTAIWASELITAYLKQQFGRDGISGVGGQARYIVNIGGQFANNAAFIPGEDITTFIFGEIPGVTGSSEVTFPVVAHEIYHAIMAVEMPPRGLDLQNESGAIFEGISDIFSLIMLAEAAKQHPGVFQFSWKLGNAYSYYIRRVDDPLKSIPSCPDRKGTPPWQPPTNFPEEVNDFGGVHKNSTIVSHWFYLLVTGYPNSVNQNNKPVPVEKIEFDRACKIFYHWTTNTLTSTGSTFDEARVSSAQSASVLYGSLSKERFAVEHAWHDVGVGAYFTRPHVTPGNADSDVIPWDAKLLWMAPIGATESIAEISNSLDFPPKNTISVKGNSASTSTDFKLMKADVHLDADTKYYWRQVHVEPAVKIPSPGLVTSFTTSKQQPVIRTTQTCEEYVHPWELELSWSDVGGADNYLIQIAESFDPKSGDPVNLLIEERVPDVSTLVNLKINSKFSWRVRAISEKGKEGVWSEEETLYTSIPAAEIETPILPGKFLSTGDDDHYRPWNLPFKWKPVKGASRYIIRITRRDPYPWYYSEVTSDTQFILNLEAAYHGEHYYDWSVQPVGPDPYNEYGALSEESFSPQGAFTIPKLVDPPFYYGKFKPNETYVPKVVEYGDPVKITFTQVQYAVGYQVTFYELNVKLGKNGKGVWKQGDVVSTQYLKATNAPTGANVTASFDKVSSPDHEYQAGYFVDVTAIGPENIQGITSVSNGYYVSPTKPIIMSPPAGAQFDKDSKVPLEWQCYHAHNETFVIWIYEEDDLNNPIHVNVLEGDAPGITKAWINGFDSGKYYWKVRPTLFEGAGVLDVIWSNLFSIILTKDDPKDDEPIYKCEEFVQAGLNESWNGWVDLGFSKGTFDFEYDFLAVPDKVIIVHDGNIIWDPGYISGKGYVSLAINGLSSKIRVTIIANPNETYWEFTVHCS